MTANLLDLKSRALFTAAYGGALDVSVTFSERMDAHYIVVDVPDYQRYGPIITPRNLVVFAVERGASSVRSSGTPSYIPGVVVRQRTFGDGGFGHVLWCGIKTGGAFCRNDDGSWRVEPDRKPLWWDGSDWASKLEVLKKDGAYRIERYAAGLPFSAH